MLKLEKKHHQDIYIGIQKRQSLFTSSFYYAFAIAFGLHLVALGFFHVQSLFFSDERILPFTQVDADISNIQNSDSELTTYIEEARQQLYALAPHASDPLFPTIAKSHPLRHIEPSKKAADHMNPFAMIEEPQHLFTPPENSGLSPISIHVSGPLSEVSFQNGHAFSNKNNILQTDKAIYDVRVERKSGKIFWFMAKQLPQNPQHNRIAESILKEIEFQQESEWVIGEGEITIFFEQQPKEFT